MSRFAARFGTGANERDIPITADAHEGVYLALVRGVAKLVPVTDDDEHDDDLPPLDAA